MGWRPRLLFCLFLSLTLAAAARAATVHQEWEISYQFKSPDCVRKLAVTINGQTPGMPDAEPFSYDGEHDVLRNYCWHKSTDEQATGLASVPLVWVGEPQSLLIIGRGRFVNCSAMAAGACNATHPERATPVFAVVPGKTYRFRIASITSLLALNFEIEDRNARLIGYSAPTVHSGSTSSSCPPMGYLQDGAALVVVMLLATGRPVADQNPATARGTIARSAPAPSASGSLPVGGGRAPPPSPTSVSSPSSGDPAGTSSNPSGTLSTPPSEGPAGTGEEPNSPPRSPPSVGAPESDNEGQLSSFLLGFLAFGTAIMAGILNAGFERILGGWSRGPKVVYKVSTWLATVFLGLAAVFMVAWYSASSMTRNRKLLSISEFCAKLGVILSINLLVVIFPCRLGRGACVAAIPAVAVITFLIATVRIWGRVIIRIIGPRRQTQLAGEGMAL